MSLLFNLEKEVSSCKKCSLWKNRIKPAFGEGPENAKIMLIGLAPGYNENLQGRPFVGAAGKFLNRLIELAGLKRSELYITSVLKCYVPDNRPAIEEIETCSRYLDRQIEIIRPYVIIPLGSVALQYAAVRFNLHLPTISMIHGKVYFANAFNRRIAIIPMYHPAAALRNGALRKVLENDWLALRNKLEEIFSSM